MLSRFGIGARLFIAFLGIAALSLSSGIAGWWILRDVSQAQLRLTREALPAVAAAQATVDATRRLLAAGQNLAAARDEATRERHAAEITALSTELRRVLADAALSQLDYTSLSQISGNAEILLANLKAQNQLVKERLQLLDSFGKRADRTLAAGTALVDLSETLVSNASAGASAVVAGLYGLIDAPQFHGAAYDALDRLIEQDIYLLDRMWELRLKASQLGLLTNRLSRAITRDEVIGLAEEFNAHLRIVKRRVVSIDDPIRRAQAEELLATLRHTAGEVKNTSSLFEDRLHVIAIGRQLESVTQRNRELLTRLDSVAQGVVTKAQSFARTTSAQADRAVAAGVWVLLATLGVAVLISGLIVWLYVERGVVRRLRELATAMNRVTRGDLAVNVKQGGTHELKALAEAVTAFRDVSRELRRHQDELQGLVDERTDQLRREVENHDAARAVAERASRAKSDFLATMSHEIRTPMTGMLGMLRVLKDEATDPEQVRRLSTASGAGEALLGILNSILDYSKIESGMIAIDAEVFRLDELLERVVGLMKPSAEEKGLSLDLALQPSLDTRFMGDAGKIRQIVFNLVSNAIKFTPTGRVTVTAGAEPADAGRQRVRIEVADTGIGIPAAARTAIFAAFTQTDSSITRRYGGTGLGLSISRGLAEAMNGTLAVVSEPGKGSAFTLTLELDDALDGLSGPLPEGTGATDRPGLSVLIVEDDEATREIAAHFLTQMGHRCTLAKDAFAALNLIREAAPDVVLMDISLPGMDGLTATHELRRALGPSTARFVAMSAHVFAGESGAYVAAGMDAFVAKPLTPEALARVITVGAEASPSCPDVDEAAWQTDVAALGVDQMRAILAIAERTLPERLSKARRALSAGDMRALAATAHAGRSTASAAGFTRLYNLLGEVETAAKQCEAARCETLLAAAEATSGKALAEAKVLLRTLQPSSAPAERRTGSPRHVT